MGVQVGRQSGAVVTTVRRPIYTCSPPTIDSLTTDPNMALF
jgi:hypothetical protein